MVRKEIFEDFIVDALLEVLNEPKHIEAIVNGIIENQSQLSENKPRLTNLLKQRKQNETTLNNIMQAVENGLMNNTTNKRMKELETLLEELERKIVVERSKKNIKLDYEQIQDYYLEGLKFDPFMLINYIVKQIKVYEDKVEITLNSPIKKSPNDKDFLFYSKYRKMQKVVQNRVEPNTLKIKVEMYV